LEQSRAGDGSGADAKRRPQWRWQRLERIDPAGASRPKRDSDETGEAGEATANGSAAGDGEIPYTSLASSTAFGREGFACPKTIASGPSAGCAAAKTEAGCAARGGESTGRLFRDVRGRRIQRGGETSQTDETSPLIACEAAVLAVLFPLVILGLTLDITSPALRWTLNIFTIAAAVTAAIIPIIFYAVTPTLPEVDR
jgi:hypothetical protein